MKLNCPILIAAFLGLVGVASSQPAPQPSGSREPSLFELGSTRAESGPARFDLKGVDTSRGAFEGTLTISRTQPLRVAWEARFAEGGTLWLQGEAKSEGRGRLRVKITSKRGMVQAIRGAEGTTSSEDELRFEIHSDRLRWRLEHWSDGKRRARATGEAMLRSTPSFSSKAAEGSMFFLGRPFVLGEGDGREIHPSDARQGRLGDCYLISAMIATARTDPDVIRRLIKDQGEGQYSLHLTDVGFFYQDATVKIDREFPYRTERSEKIPAFAKFGDTLEVGGKTYYELWPAMIEKAYAQYKGGYSTIEGGHSSLGFTMISGKSSTTYLTILTSIGRIQTVLSSALRDGNPACVGTVKSLDKGGVELNLVGGHAYVVWSEPKTGRYRLYNPWGYKHPSRAMTAAEINRYCNTIYVGGF